MTKAENARINKELKALMDTYKKDYEGLRQQSEHKYKSSLQPGQTFREQQGFYTEEERAAFRTIGADIRSKAQEILNKASIDIMAEELKAPSTEAVNVVTLLNARQNVSAEEIDQLMTMYGLDCPLVYKALFEKASSLGYRDFKRHPIEQTAENIRALSGSINSTFNPRNAERDNLIMTAAVFNSSVDAAFPAEE